MEDRPYITVGELPPRPDVVTGEPRPPRAPVFNAKGEAPAGPGSPKVRDETRTPLPPEGEGPVLEWYRRSKVNSIKIGMLGFIAMAIGLTVMQGFSQQWAQFWWIWVILVLASLGVYSSDRAAKPEVGAEWLKNGKAWVRIYELVEIRGKARGRHIELTLRDRDDRYLQIGSGDLQEDGELWDLVYNGMLHSIIEGEANVDSVVHFALRLPYRNPYL